MSRPNNRNKNRPGKSNFNPKLAGSSKIEKTITSNFHLDDDYPHYASTTRIALAPALTHTVGYIPKKVDIVKKFLSPEKGSYVVYDFMKTLYQLYLLGPQEELNLAEAKDAKKTNNKEFKSEVKFERDHKRNDKPEQKSAFEKEKNSPNPSCKRGLQRVALGVAGLFKAISAMADASISLLTTPAKESKRRATYYSTPTRHYGLAGNSKTDLIEARLTEKGWRKEGSEADNAPAIEAVKAYGEKLKIADFIIMGPAKQLLDAIATVAIRHPSNIVSTFFEAFAGRHLPEVLTKMLFNIFRIAPEIAATLLFKYLLSEKTYEWIPDLYNQIYNEIDSPGFSELGAGLAVGGIIYLPAVTAALILQVGYRGKLMPALEDKIITKLENYFWEEPSQKEAKTTARIEVVMDSDDKARSARTAVKEADKPAASSIELTELASGSELPLAPPAENSSESLSPRKLSM